MAEQLKIDPEWVLLMLKAKELGLSIEEIQAFIRSRSERGETVSATYTKRYRCM